MKKKQQNSDVNPETAAQMEYAQRMANEEKGAETEAATDASVQATENKPETTETTEVTNPVQLAEQQPVGPAYKKTDDRRQFNREVMAGIAVRTGRDLRDAIDVAQKAGLLWHFTVSESRHLGVFGAMDEAGLDALAALESELSRAKIQYCLAMAVPISALQTEPKIREDSACRHFCSQNGLPFFMKKDRETGVWRFSRPRFWRIEVIANEDDFYFLATLYGQYADPDGVLSYRPMYKGEDETALITDKFGDEVELITKLNIPEGFVRWMLKSCDDLIRRAKQGKRVASRANTLRRSASLNATLAERGIDL